MVTCQSANQLKTPAKISWAFKMVSQFGSLGYTIMRKTADLTVVQKTIIDTLHKEGKPQTCIGKKLTVHRVLHPNMLTESWVEGKSVEEKDAQPTERTAALWGLSSKIDSRIWVNFTRNGLRLGSRHQEPPHTDVSRNLATVVVRGVLPGLRRRRTGHFTKSRKWKLKRNDGAFGIWCRLFSKRQRETNLLQHADSGIAYSCFHLFS